MERWTKEMKGVSILSDKAPFSAGAAKTIKAEPTVTSLLFETPLSRIILK